MMNESTRREFLLTLSTALLAAGTLGCTRETQTADDEIATLFTSLKGIVDVTIAEQKAVGITFGIQKMGEAPLLGASGKSTLSASTPIKNNTPMRIASVTKVFIAVAVMKLIEEGKLRLSQPLSDFFPSFPDGNKVTIYHLLSHTSGLKDWWEAGLPEDAPGDFTQQPHPHRVLERVNSPYHFEPGEHHWYSNTAFVLLGDVVETVTEKPLGKFLEQAIFSPYKLENTYYDPNPEQSKKWGAGHHVSPESDTGFVQTGFTGSPGAAGGIWSTPRDLLQWSNALYDGSLISAASIANMTEFAQLNDGRPVYESTWHPDWMEARPPKIEFMQQYGWGLGFSLFTSNNQKVVWHGGGIPGFNAIWLNIPAQSLSIAMLANTDNGVMPAFEKIVPEAVKNQ